MTSRKSPTFLQDTEESNESLLIHDIARMMKKNFDRRARSLGLTRAQWLTVSLLRRHPGIKQNELAELLDVEPITVARSVARMEKSGWIERRADTGDRRVKRLYLTPRALEIATRIRSFALEIRQEALGNYTAKDHEQLLTLLHKLKKNLCQVCKAHNE